MAAECRRIERTRSLILYLSLLTFAFNAVCAIALQFLPSDTSRLAFNFSLYSVCGAIISLLGFIGVIRNSPTLLTVFSNHLILDALLSTLPRLLLLPVFLSLPTTLCSFFDPRHPVLHSQSGTTTPQQHLRDVNAEPWVRQRCAALTWGALAIAGAVMVAVTGMQWVCAWRVREYGRWLETEGGKEKVERGEEKA